MKVLQFAVAYSRVGGHAVLKMLGSSNDIFKEVTDLANSWYTKVVSCKPPASRLSSDERYLVCLARLEQRRTSPLPPSGPRRYGLDDWPWLSPQIEMETAAVFVLSRLSASNSQN